MIEALPQTVTADNPLREPPDHGAWSICTSGCGKSAWSSERPGFAADTGHAPCCWPA